MRKILLVILAILLIIILPFAGYVAMQPADYRISRKATLPSPPAEVFAQVNDFHNWNDWSPWAKLDPKAEFLFEGVQSGQGAIFKWSGNSEVGQGEMEITESKPNELIRLKLKFLKPMQSVADTEFTFKPVGTDTEVTWTMSGKRKFLEKAICVFMNMDKMVGGQFEKGLDNMETVLKEKPDSKDKKEKNKEKE
jgi:hypothetical protein